MTVKRRQRRRGATVLEMALILFVFIVVTMGILDLGVGVFRYHVLSHAATHVARRAIVHGALADQLGAWGPGSIDVMASASGVPAIDGSGEGVSSKLIGCDLSRTRVRLEWLDGSNEFEDRVRVSVTSPFRPVLTSFFGGTEITLSASCTMLIAH